jgi:predicted transcriptional regulator
MQRVAVTIRLSVKDAANVEELCEVLHKKPSEWYREAIEQTLDEYWQKFMKPVQDKENEAVPL